MAKKEQNSEISGTVWKIEASVGDQVSEGDTLLILESMKMEIPVMASEPGKLVEILVKKDQLVEEGQSVAVLEV